MSEPEGPRPAAEAAAAAEDALASELCRELGDAIVEIEDGRGLTVSTRAAALADTADTADAAGEAGAKDLAGREGSPAGELTVEVRREDVARVAAAMRSRFRYTVLVDLCAADDPERSPRFEVIYLLYSFRENRRLRLKVRTGPGEPVPTVTGVWRGAEWPEREAHDMFGIEFAGHPDPSPLLLWEGFAGYPLCKDFPLAGVDTGAALDREPSPPDGAGAA